VKMVQRVIGGGAIGTQGTPVAVLAGLTRSRLFPALWDVRNTLTEIADS
jgi:tryptophan 2,3-dioxygenase